MSNRDNIALPRPQERENREPHPASIRRIASQTLLGADGQLVIEHDGQEYLLRRTQAGKLLLTK